MRLLFILYWLQTSELFGYWNIVWFDRIMIQQLFSENLSTIIIKEILLVKYDRLLAHLFKGKL